MTRTLLLVIDVQQSFYHRGYRDTPETPEFERCLGTLIEGCLARNIPVVDVFHVEEDGPFSLASGACIT